MYYKNQKLSKSKFLRNGLSESFILFAVASECRAEANKFPLFSISNLLCCKFLLLDAWLCC